MLHYIVILFLTTLYRYTLAIPLLPNVSNGSLAFSMATLAHHCENPFLSAQITSKLNDCNVKAPPYNEKQFACLIFYDINSQLCDAISKSKLVLKDDDFPNLNLEQDVEKVCEEAKGWHINFLKEYSAYKVIVENVFSNKVACAKACGVDDLTSQDTNYFCKYYKWGKEILNNSVSTALNQIYSEHVLNSALPSVSQTKPHNITDATSTNDLNSAMPPKEDIVNANKTTNLKVEEAPKPEEIKLDVAIQETSTNKQDYKELSAIGEVAASEKSTSEVPKPSKVEEEQVPAQTNVEIDEGIEKPVVDLPVLEKNRDGKLDSLSDTLNVQLNNPKETAEKNKPQSVDDDYQDSEEGKEGLSDMQGGDDGDDPMLGDLESKAALQKNTAKRVESPISTFNGEREFFPNAFQEGFTEDDDHFFSFFLTAVILVILLYVLYHNKSKVSKVFLGLIVEGRQSSRRRNSRGHAYRRLDTLEQAMNTNTAAPPSKIIY